MTGQRILIVDDDLHIRRLLQATLLRAGYAAIEATTAAEALAQAKAERPDAILLDLGLPDRDGLEIVPLLRRLGHRADPRPVGAGCDRPEGRGARSGRARLCDEAVRQRGRC